MANHPDRSMIVLPHLQGAFGGDSFGKRAEAFARFFGTPRFLIGQTVLVVAWIVVNVAAAALRWDPYPFILLNLAFSLQAAYAAPLILLAQTRQADRDKAISQSDSKHREGLAADFLQKQELVTQQNDELKDLLQANIRLTSQIEELTVKIHGMLVTDPPR